MSKGHVEQLRALREAKFAAPGMKPTLPVTKLQTMGVTKLSKAGRPKVHASNADRQRAYRKKVKQ